MTPVMFIAFPFLWTMGTEGSFPGGKALPGRDAEHLPHLVPWSRISRSSISSPLAPTWR